MKVNTPITGLHLWVRKTDPSCPAKKHSKEIRQHGVQRLDNIQRLEEILLWVELCPSKVYMLKS